MSKDGSHSFCNMNSWSSTLPKTLQLIYINMFHNFMRSSREPLGLKQSMSLCLKQTLLWLNNNPNSVSISSPTNDACATASFLPPRTSPWVRAAWNVSYLGSCVRRRASRNVEWAVALLYLTPRLCESLRMRGILVLASNPVLVAEPYNTLSPCCVCQRAK